MSRRKGSERRRQRYQGEWHPLVGYYVEKYVRKNYGTLSQLKHGSREHMPKEGVSKEILTRLTLAWRAMRSTPAGFPKAYEIGGEWGPIISHAFQPLVDALDKADYASLSTLLPRFFRLFGDYLGEPTDFASEPIRRYRTDLFRVWSSRWIDLYGDDSLLGARAPVIGNPAGFRLNGELFTIATFVYNFYARRMEDLNADIAEPIVCEIGGGFGGFAYHLLNRPSKRFKYIDYDIPVMSIISAYLLLSALSDKRLGLYGEIETLSDPLRNVDAAILPNFALPHLAEGYADTCFNSCSFAEMDKPTVEEYMRQVERICCGYFLHVNHSWTAESHNARRRNAKASKSPQ